MKWSEEQVQYLRANYFGKRIAQIAEEMNRTRASVYIKAQELGLTKVPRKPKEENGPQPEG
jgi:hypothetical protein